jgi:hypothetical protein|tara:strand:- start:2159 stop:2350 length:192 start_codon:yes stop_codon:yes gene_type:complete
VKTLKDLLFMPARFLISGASFPVMMAAEPSQSFSTSLIKMKNPNITFADLLRGLDGFLALSEL